MTCKRLREPKTDMGLVYAHVKTDRLHDVEELLSMADVADILSVGEKRLEDELWASKLLFSSVLNWACLATTLIYLGNTQAAVESAR